MHEKRLEDIPLSKIMPNRFQPRIYFDEEKIENLAKSISRYGVLEPIIVRPTNGKYEIIAGERRFKASKLAGKSIIPSIIVEYSDKESIELALLENIQRQELTAIEEAIAYRRILDMGYITQEDLAQKIGKSQPTIANKLRLLALDDETQEALINHKISERHARSLLKLTGTGKELEMLNRIIKERLTVRRTDEEIMKLLDKDQKEVSKKENNEENLKETSMIDFDKIERLLADFEEDSKEIKGENKMDIEKIMQEAKDINEEKGTTDMTAFINTPTLTETAVNNAPINDIADIMNSGKQKVEQNKFINIVPTEEKEEIKVEEPPKQAITFDSVFNSSFSETTNMQNLNQTSSLGTNGQMTMNEDATETSNYSFNSPLSVTPNNDDILNNYNINDPIIDTAVTPEIGSNIETPSPSIDINSITNDSISTPVVPDIAPFSSDMGSNIDVPETNNYNINAPIIDTAVTPEIGSNIETPSPSIDINSITNDSISTPVVPNIAPFSSDIGNNIGASETNTYNKKEPIIDAPANNISQDNVVMPQINSNIDASIPSIDINVMPNEQESNPVMSDITPFSNAVGNNIEIAEISNNIPETTTSNSGIPEFTSTIAESAAGYLNPNMTEVSSPTEIDNMAKAKEIIAKCEDELKAMGYNVIINQMDLESIYQASIVINK